jgi:medium-chain acyl-[acyl-carrier-protein] hydrolase
MTSPNLVSVKARTSPWLVCNRPNPSARLRLFCLPYAGGAAAIFREWPTRLQLPLEVCPVELPGRGRRIGEPPSTHLASLVEALSEAMLPHLDKPFAIVGHSMGALLGFELARQLRRKGAPLPQALFVSGRRAPHLPNTDPVTYDLPVPQFLQTLYELKGTPREVLESPELIELLLPVLRADFEICETYVYSPEPPLGLPISACGGLQDDGVPPSALREWRAQTAGDFSMRMMSGDHFFINTHQSTFLRVLAQQLHQLLETLA